jgi:hypothetical protein
VEIRRVAAISLFAALLAGCGGDSGWSQARCRDQAQRLAARAGSMVRHYHGSTVYPADVSYLQFRNGLDLFQKGRCEPRDLGAALRRQLDSSGGADLVRLLPGNLAPLVRDALSER